jgi:hypothetical protein
MIEVRNCKQTVSWGFGKKIVNAAQFLSRLENSLDEFYE